MTQCRQLHLLHNPRSPPQSKSNRIGTIIIKCVSLPSALFRAVAATLSCVRIGAMKITFKHSWRTRTVSWITFASRPITRCCKDDTFVRKIVQLTPPSKHSFASKATESPPFPDLHKFTENFKTTSSEQYLKEITSFTIIWKHRSIPLCQHSKLYYQNEKLSKLMQRLRIWTQLFTLALHSKCPQNNQQQANGNLEVHVRTRTEKEYASLCLSWKKNKWYLRLNNKIQSNHQSLYTTVAFQLEM